MVRNLIVALSVTAAALGAAGIDGKAEAGAPKVNVSFGGPGWSFGYSNSYWGSPNYPGYYPAYYPVVAQQYDVVYRACPGEPWRIYGTYYSHSFAHEVVERLEWRGYQARVAHH